ncbi:expressed unknown protein [Ectocarpus siliculosus]|uniref:Uncharacterized protein n=1 Tax=Ectocarpus siliculosus TaxID=2880 RepID=D7FRD0_ECTSI|nr:expressed unknown protein [Ectocarpus siliculosus]|eukprot:CBJ30721.1 expressed unknown protein [Ectocarpus siliculosus]
MGARWVLTTVLAMTLINPMGGQDNGDENGGDAADDDGTTTEEDEAEDYEDEDTGSEGTSTEVIVVAVLLSALVLGNVACAAWYFLRRCKTPPTRLPHHRSGIADAELDTLRKKVATEKSRRELAEADMEAARRQLNAYESLVLRSEVKGVRPGNDFPSVRSVLQEIKHGLIDDALRWTEKVSTLGGSQAGLTATIRAVLEHTFHVCRKEAMRCLDNRLRAFTECLGEDEPISLSGDKSMNLDTEYVLYTCLCRNYKTIVSMKPSQVQNLAVTIVQRCKGHEDLAGSITSGNARPFFDALMKHYLQVFIVMGLQNPPMGFKDDDLGMNTTFDGSLHRYWAPCSNTPIGQQCTIVFPSIVLEGGRVNNVVKIGVVHVPV